MVDVDFTRLDVFFLFGVWDLALTLLVYARHHHQDRSMEKEKSYLLPIFGYGT